MAAPRAARHLVMEAAGGTGEDALAPLALEKLDPVKYTTLAAPWLRCFHGTPHLTGITEDSWDLSQCWRLDDVG